MCVARVLVCNENQQFVPRVAAHFERWLSSLAVANAIAFYPANIHTRARIHTHIRKYFFVAIPVVCFLLFMTASVRTNNADSKAGAAK